MFSTSSVIALTKYKLKQYDSGYVGDTLDQQYGVNHYHNIEISRSYQQNGYVAERPTNNLETINEGYITTPVEYGICFSITGSPSSQDHHINPF